MALKKLWGRHMTCMKASRQVGKQEWFKLVSMLLKEK
ncbi:hypothetical protein FOCG_08059 [Fusarium oxysporum f. sp. radicis-lycopersici 26381]|uniref:Uncharacterized protein n=1 Tax=Fusarium oxysporum Fo47 TaxID=660027 RepID=W9JFT5_FUSOX|nr:hypothetical protein FOZG_15350 [Fusarium oxysporum Fo47]EXL52241.1 hypothetical protein FOCG_08059 [Fusarium oxysporum f. sp. radicis-lycopersici 26381]